LFPHIFWDATFFWGVDVFSDYREWFIEALKAACANDKLNWLVKVHPAHVVKQHRDGAHGLTSEEEAIRESIGTLPPHVRLLPPDVDISTWSLFGVMDYCLTVRGTVGIEAAMLGKRALTCGTGRYDGHGFTLDYQDRETYLADLARLQDIPPPSATEIELARRFAYGLFLARSTPIASARIQFTRDATASLDVGLAVSTPEEANAAPDIAAIAQWIESGDEDYLHSLKE
jgi:capsule polysaccharide export protein KpsC/LpsZ